MLLARGSVWEAKRGTALSGKMTRELSDTEFARMMDPLKSGAQDAAVRSGLSQQLSKQAEGSDR